MTAKELAQMLGVSPSAISIAFTGKKGISDETRARILEAAAREGVLSRAQRKAISYPALGASATAPGADTLWGETVSHSRGNLRYVIFLDHGDTVKETDFHGIVLRGIESRARQLGYNVSITYFNASDNWAPQLQEIAADTDGIILLATEVHDEHINRAVAEGLGNLEVPLVMVDNATTMVDIDCLVGDNLLGAYHAASHLFNRGFEDVGYLRSSSRIDNFDEREAGLKKARLEHGLSPDEPLSVINVGISSEQAYADLSAYLRNGGTVLPAYFADNDIIAAASMRAFHDFGYKVPVDVSIIGFDNMPLCTLTEPQLTTVNFQKEQLGILAVNIMDERLRSGSFRLCDDRFGAMRVTLTARVIERGSVR